ncbi:hypothetical protein [Nocardioides cynanchi]|uniref:hypothetical protein n=1 Tax=Nocardioides cynanchi TaxID=2558918 RepID=UPI001244012E|nr:hypothetical protein [Nocardioides cynanchi]
MPSSQDVPTGADYGPGYPAPTDPEPPMKPHAAGWQPWVIVLVAVCVVAVLMLAGAFAVWLYIWSHFDG